MASSRISETDGASLQGLRDRFEKATEEHGRQNATLQDRENELRDFDAQWAAQTSKTGLDGMELDDLPEWLSSVTAALVLMLSAVNPAVPNCAENAIVKQPAWAAAINSSGLVPGPSSKRALKPYRVLLSTPLCVVILPLPSLRPPVQAADAVRFISGAPF